jgi:ribosomal protein S17
MEQKQKKTDKEVGKVKAVAMQDNKTYSLRGRKFEGYVIKKFENRVVIKFERMIFIRKYERYLKTYSKMHARLPKDFKEQINIGDYIQIMECRPLSKIIHFIVVKKIRDADSKASEIIRETDKKIKTKKKVKEEEK